MQVVEWRFLGGEGNRVATQALSFSYVKQLNSRVLLYIFVLTVNNLKF